jgi:hypothetical protein
MKKTNETTTTSANTLTSTTTTTTSNSNIPTKDWSVEEVALLIKAANKFPGGVSDRWETIAAYVALHTGLPQRDPDDVIKKSKAVQKGSHQEATVRQLQFQKKTYDIAEAPTVRYDIEDEVAPVVGTTGDAEKGDTASGKKKKGTAANTAAAGAAPAKASASPAPKAATRTTPAVAAIPATPATPVVASTTTPPASSGVGAKTAALAALASPTAAAAASTPAGAPAASLWTAAEQKLLEAGMKTYPPSWQGEGDRWDKIAESVPGRTKKECKLRVKVSLALNCFLCNFVCTVFYGS